MNGSSIFTHMPSLLIATHPGAHWPVNLQLPEIDFGVRSSIPSEGESHLREDMIGLEFIAPPLTSKSSNAIQAKSDISCKPRVSELTNIPEDKPIAKPRKARRRTKAWLCKHLASQHYAKGICQFCYLQRYNAARKGLQEK